MTLALRDDFQTIPGMPVRRARGQVNHRAGTAAEDSVSRDYARRGYPELRRRWRGKAGEVDLIFRDGKGVVFVEVKCSRTFDGAVQHLTARQIERLQRAAEEFLGTQPLGLLTEMRFDVALVNGHGEISVLENAIGAM
ncbi:YraN family protein [Tropicibacter sp. S64]|uniref:YraN family protein n=1 Tax=Tropicibacter sp. S64 TaxID=3415122 RepID=UPI003C7D7492